MKYLLIVTILFVNLFSNSLEEFKKNKNKVYASVNEYKITQEDIDNNIKKKLQDTFFHKKISTDKRKEYVKKALDELIQNEVLYQYALRKNLQVKQDILNNRYEIILNRFKSEKELIEALKKSSLSLEDLKKQIKKEELTRVVYLEHIQKEFTNKDLKDYYENNKYKFVMPSSKKIQLIRVNINPSLKDAKKLAKEKIEIAYKKIKDGKNFEDIAKEYSEDNSRIFGGNLGFIHEGQIPYIQEELKSLKKGELSQIIEADIGFYLINVLDIKEEKQMSFIQIKENLKKDLVISNQEENLKIILKEQKELLNIQVF